MLAIVAVIFWSCQEHDMPLTREQQQQRGTAAAEDNSDMLQTSREILDMTGAAIDDQGVSSGRIESDGRIANGGYSWKCRPSISADFDLDRSSQDSTVYSGTVLIDFGDGSSCPDSTHVRTGKITDTFQLVFQHHDSVHTYSLNETLTFEAFSRDSLLLDGVFITHRGSDMPTILVISDAHLTYPDGTMATWEGSLTFEHDNNGTFFDWRDDQKTITGSISGTTHDGVDFAATITEPVLFDYACFGRHEVPVSGIVEIDTGGALTTVDYGDGTCDMEYSITTGGETTVYTFNEGHRHHEDNDHS